MSRYATSFVWDDGYTTSLDPHNQASSVRPPERINAMLRALGDVIYFLRMPDGTIKIGFTTNLAARWNNLGRDAELLAWRSGTYAEEQSIHRALSGSLKRGREWYYPDDEVMNLVEIAKEELFAYVAAQPV